MSPGQAQEIHLPTIVLQGFSLLVFQGVVKKRKQNQLQHDPRRSRAPKGPKNGSPRSLCLSRTVRQADG